MVPGTHTVGGENQLLSDLSSAVHTNTVVGVTPPTTYTHIEITLKDNHKTPPTQRDISA